MSIRDQNITSITRQNIMPITNQWMNVDMICHATMPYIVWPDWLVSPTQIDMLRAH